MRSQQHWNILELCCNHFSLMLSWTLGTSGFGAQDIEENREQVQQLLSLRNSLFIAFEGHEQSGG